MYINTYAYVYLTDLNPELPSSSYAEKTKIQDVVDSEDLYVSQILIARNLVAVI